jgi:hypothetical protein
MNARTVGRWILGLAAVAFGVATIISGSRVLFGDALVRAEAGQVVPFVLVFNVCAGFAYVVTGLLALTNRRWARPLAWGLAAATLLVFAGLGVHIATDGAYEVRTLKAMTVRSVFWIVQAAGLGYVFAQSSGRRADT